MDNAYALGLVYAWLMEHPEHFCSWVAPHTQLRYNNKTRKMGAVSVGGHWRRMCGWKNVLPALLCTCKFELVCKPKYLSAPPMGVVWPWDEEGDYVPRQYRVLVWA